MINMLEGVLRRPKTVFVLMIALLVAGIFSYINIPKEDSPDIDVPVFYVSISQQGISPEDAERLLIRPMETELRGLDGLKEITAIASEGHAGIVLEFDISFDKDEAMADVRDKVDAAKGELACRCGRTDDLRNQLCVWFRQSRLRCPAMCRNARSTSMPAA